MLLYLHPAIESMMSGRNSGMPYSSDYYKQKANFLKKHLGEINKETKPQEFLSKIKAETVKQQVIDLKQLTLEVTEDCNLKCKYCGYGEFYCDYEERERRYMPFDTFKNTFEYLENIWRKHASSKVTVYISFYGGEPLLNMDFIKKAVGYVRKKSIPYRNFKFNMTTNGVLLRKHIRFFIENDFHILVSLDGNKKNNEYRVSKNNTYSFDIIYNNLIYIKNKFPDFFTDNIEFMTVLHDKNSVVETMRFINKTFEKTPSFSPLSPTGIREEKKEEFEIMLNKSISKSMKSLNSYEKENMATKHPENSMITNYIKRLSGNTFNTYSDLFTDKGILKYFPTGTCLPFGKRMFITANGKILPCERVGHRFVLGEVKQNKFIVINYEEVAKKYTEYYKSINNQCTQCYQSTNCTECIFKFKDFKNVPICDKVIKLENYKMYLYDTISLLEEENNISNAIKNWI